MSKNYFLLFCSLFFFVPSPFPSPGKVLSPPERGVFDVVFMGEKVGYEEYTWQPVERGYLLTIRGRLTKPIPMEIDKITLRLDEGFIPTQYIFEGSVSGVRQEILSVIDAGRVANVILVAGQEQKSDITIKRDAFLLPNAVYSPYMVLTKKFACSLQERMELSAYIIPQFETNFFLAPSEETPCHLTMEMDGSETLLETDEEGKLNALHIPLKNLHVLRVPE